MQPEEQPVEGNQQEVVPDFPWNVHTNFLFYHYNFLPQPYQSSDSNRVTLAYFVLGAMDVLNVIDHPKLNKKDVIEWIYSLQILPNKSDPEVNKHNLGFRGSNFFVTPDSCSVRRHHN
jgi:geranylgeranyl transferase type-1 subunit beta